MTVLRWKPTPLALIMLQRLWQGAAGVVSIVIMTRMLSAETQGWYYSFLSFAALYTLFDLGLSLVLVQTAAHFSTDSRWISGGYIVGQGSEQLRGLISFAGRHYIHLALGFVIVVVPTGWIFFSTSAVHPVVWQPAWIVLAVVTGFSLLPIPFLAIVEGSGDVAAVAGIRLAQSLLGAFATWVVLLAGGGLWATVMMPLASLLTGFGWILTCRPGILSAFRTDRSILVWRTEIWPLQWRLGLSWLGGYLLTQIQTLILFATADATAAGQMGLSLTIGNMLGLIAQSFIARHIPAMAKAAARRDWKTLDGLFERDFLLSSMSFLAAAIAVVMLALVVQDTPYGARILPPWPLAGLLFTLFLAFVQGALAAQLRSYRKEPLVWVALSGAICTMTLAIPASHMAGAAGVVCVMLFVQVVVSLPCSVIVFYRRNRSWREV